MVDVQDMQRLIREALEGETEEARTAAAAALLRMGVFVWPSDAPLSE